ncbi:MAG: protein-L-isoaspartate O-methyltransferase [Treponema sp.]|nr:protein-L-isoaspartate O-methyltransferase [Treponema sp.]
MDGDPSSARRGRSATRAAESNDELVRIVKYRAASYLTGGVRDARVLDAMRDIDRARFLPHEYLWAAYLDESVDIGRGQTCSQPSMTAFMLDKLSLRPGLRVLEIGAGSGYAAALAALLCRPGGRVIAVEIIPELAARALANCASAGPRYGPPLSDDIDFVAADGSAGLGERGPFDRILVSAGVRRSRLRGLGGGREGGSGAEGGGGGGFREEPLLDQLGPGGILVYPEERGNLYRIERRGEALLRDRWSGVAFVPLRGRNA